MGKVVAVITLVSAFLGFAAVSPARAEKWALMVGVNEYQAPSIPGLRGCENDIYLMKKVLTDRYGFPEKNIRTIFSKDATKKRIVEEFNTWLVAQAKPDDVVVFDYSGHGSQILAKKTEAHPDGLDSTICPTDIRTSAALNDIPGEELGRMISKLKARSITVILDSCHSGGGTRDLDPLLAPTTATDPGRYTAARVFIRPQLLEGTPVAAASRPGPLSLFAMGPAGPAGPAGDRDEPKKDDMTATATVSHALLAGCMSDQTSADACFPGGDGKFYYFGALTYNLAGALSQADPKDPSWTYERVMKLVVAGVKRRGFRQDPHLEEIGTNPVRILFRPVEGAPEANPPTPPTPPAKPFVLVSAVGGDRVELAAGATAGVTAKSVYTIYEATDNALDGKGVAMVEVVSVGATASTARILRADAGLKVGCRAVETQHFYPVNALYVTVLDQDAARRSAIEAALKKIRFVGLATPNQTTDRWLRAEVENGKLTGWLVNPEGRSFPKRQANDPAGLVAALQKDLSNAYVLKRLALLDNPTPDINVDVSVDGKAVKMEGETIVFRFKADKDCYLTLVDCGTSGEITVIFPNARHKDNHIVAGKEYSIPSTDMDFELETHGPPGREMVKAIATVKPVDLMNFDYQKLTDDRPFLTRDINQSLGESRNIAHNLACGIGEWLQEARGKDFVVIPRRKPEPPAPAAPPVAQQTLTQPPTPQVTVPATPLKPPATPQAPVQITPEAIPTGGWATASVMVDVKSKDVEATKNGRR